VQRQPTERKQRPRIGERHTPAVECDHDLEIADRLAQDQLAVER
jgi:hypothetical protein